MSVYQSILLGIVQGMTEFIPVSSTAHLILTPWWFAWTFEPDAAFVFNVLLQLGTLAAVVAYFAVDLLRIARAMLRGLGQRRPFETADARLGWLIAVGTVPAAAIGFVFKPLFAGLHQSPVIVGAILLGTAGLLFVSEELGRRTRTLESLTWVDALVIGLAQSLALLPGVSRSAATISGGLVRDLERPAAARFSFLLSVPVMLAAGVLAVRDLVALPGYTAYLAPLAMGFLAAAGVGFLSIRWLLSYLARHPLNLFAWYRIGVGLLTIALFILRGG